MDCPPLLVEARGQICSHAHDCVTPGGPGCGLCAFGPERQCSAELQSWDAAAAHLGLDRPLCVPLGKCPCWFLLLLPQNPLNIKFTILTICKGTAPGH